MAQFLVYSPASLAIFTKTSSKEVWLIAQSMIPCSFRFWNTLNIWEIFTSVLFYFILFALYNIYLCIYIYIFSFFHIIMFWFCFVLFACFNYWCVFRLDTYRYWHCWCSFFGYYCLYCFYCLFSVYIIYHTSTYFFF